MNELSWNMVFDGWTSVLRTLSIGTFAYAALVVLLRVSGKRTLSKMNAFDFVVTVAFGSTLATVLISKDVSLAQGVVALALLVVLQFINTFIAVRWKWYSGLIKATPTLVFYQGHYLDDAMRAQRLTQEEVLAAMRKQGIAEPDEVAAVIIETEGSLSIIQDGLTTADGLKDLGVDVSSEKVASLEQLSNDHTSAVRAEG
ncbi:DUF421 domain-containing protein [Roseimaritima sediminicola]|uniref:DUF421 domain-containing protein n=1 Tax=Roseimaritima sediminicola TaxID=2662066 RepID=UPI00192A1CFB|nr:YetF domain-containing protein [Roseimaritima sediminicola]